MAQTISRPVIGGATLARTGPRRSRPYLLVFERVDIPHNMLGFAKGTFICVAYSAYARYPVKVSLCR